MSETITPLTDKEAYDVGGEQHPQGSVVSAEFARRLERQIASLSEYAHHAPACPFPVKPCDCGLAELIDKLKPTPVNRDG